MRSLKFSAALPGGGASSGPVTWAAIAATLTLAACNNPVKDAEERYHMVERNGTMGELCRAAHGVAEAYLQSKKESDYRYWRAVAGIRCQLAEFDGPNSMAQQSDATRQAKADAEAAAADAMSVAAEAAKGSAHVD